MAHEAKNRKTMNQPEAGPVHRSDLPLEFAHFLAGLADWRGATQPVAAKRLFELFAQQENRFCDADRIYWKGWP